VVFELNFIALDDQKSRLRLHEMAGLFRVGVRTVSSTVLDNTLLSLHLSTLKSMGAKSGSHYPQPLLVRDPTHLSPGAEFANNGGRRSR
jgi:hypothetical protein